MLMRDAKKHPLAHGSLPLPNNLAHQLLRTFIIFSHTLPESLCQQTRRSARKCRC